MGTQTAKTARVPMLSLDGVISIGGLGVTEFGDWFKARGLGIRGYTIATKYS